MSKRTIYMIGISCLGLGYHYIKETLGGGVLFVAFMITVVIFISWLAHRFGKGRKGRKREGGI